MVSLISVVFFFHVHLIWWAGCSDKTIQLFKKRSQKTRKWNEWNNKSPIQWFKIHIICVDMSTFHFSPWQVLFKKISSSVPLTFKFWEFITEHSLEIKESATCQKWFSKGTDSYTLLLLNLISWQQKVNFELIDISEYQYNAYLLLMLLLFTLKVPLWWTLF